MATLFIAGISSCSKQNPQPDLTTGIVGTYLGGIEDTTAGTPSTSATGLTLTVTKIDNTHIQVTPPSGYIPFTATLTSATNGLYIQTSAGVYGGYPYVGSQFINNLTAPVNGAYAQSTNQFTYSLLQIINGVYVYEVFVGTHQ